MGNLDRQSGAESSVLFQLSGVDYGPSATIMLLGTPNIINDPNSINPTGVAPFSEIVLSGIDTQQNANTFFIIESFPKVMMFNKSMESFIYLTEPQYRVQVIWSEYKYKIQTEQYFLVYFFKVRVFLNVEMINLLTMLETAHLNLLLLPFRLL